MQAKHKKAHIIAAVVLLASMLLSLVGMAFGSSEESSRDFGIAAVPFEDVLVNGETAGIDFSIGETFTADIDVWSTHVVVNITGLSGDCSYEVVSSLSNLLQDTSSFSFDLDAATDSVVFRVMELGQVIAEINLNLRLRYYTGITLNGVDVTGELEGTSTLSLSRTMLDDEARVAFTGLSSDVTVTLDTPPMGYAYIDGFSIDKVAGQESHQSVRLVHDDLGTLAEIDFDFFWFPGAAITLDGTALPFDDMEWSTGTTLGGTYTSAVSDDVTIAIPGLSGSYNIAYALIGESGEISYTTVSGANNFSIAQPSAGGTWPLSIYVAPVVPSSDLRDFELVLSLAWPATGAPPFSDIELNGASATSEQWGMLESDNRTNMVMGLAGDVRIVGLPGGYTFRVAQEQGVDTSISSGYIWVSSDTVTGQRSFTVEILDDTSTVAYTFTVECHAPFSALVVNGRRASLENLMYGSGYFNVAVPDVTLQFEGVAAGTTFTAEGYGFDGDITRSGNTLTMRLSSGSGTVTLNFSGAFGSFQTSINFRYDFYLPTVYVDGTAYPLVWQQGDDFIPLPSKITTQKTEGFSLSAEAGGRQYIGFEAREGGIEKAGDGTVRLLLDGEEAQEVRGIVVFRFSMDDTSGPEEFYVEIVFNYAPEGSGPGPDPGEEDEGDGGGGGGGGNVTPDPVVKPEDIRVINITDEEKLTNVTTLFVDPTMQGDVAVSTPTGAEFGALLAMIDRNIDNIPVGERVAEIDLSALSGGGDYLLNLTGDQYNELMKRSIDAFQVATASGGVRLWREGMEDIDPAAGEWVQIRLSRFDNNGLPGADVQVFWASRPVTRFDGDYAARVSIPFTPAAGMTAESYFAEYIDDAGTRHVVTESWYDAENKLLHLSMGHLSKFGVGYNTRTFRDVPASHAASGSVAFLAARGIIPAGEGDLFRPDQPITRAEFLTLYTRALSSVNIGSIRLNFYRDVTQGDPYAQITNWFYANNIAGALPDDSYFRPDDPLAREDVFTLVDNVLGCFTVHIKPTKRPAEFGDMGSVSAHAQAAVERLNGWGVLHPDTLGQLRPGDRATRAEAAVLIAELISKIA